jgi:hypothetical protein
VRTLGRPRAQLALAAALVAAAAAVVLAVVLVGGDEEPSAGPLGSDEVQGLGAPQEAGRTFTFGLPVAYNEGDEPAVLDRISLLDPTPGLEVVGTRVAGADRRLLYQSGDPDWPSRRITDQHPVNGFEVAPQDTPEGRRGVELVFGLRADRPGRYRTRGVQIDYRVGDTRHRSTMLVALQLCIPPRGVAAEGRRCPTPPVPREES